MSTRSVLLAALALALASTACQPAAQEAGPLSEEDIAAIKSIGPALDEAALAGDWDAIAALFTEDVVLMPPNGTTIEGRGVFREWVESLGLVATEHMIEFTDVGGHGDVAYGRANYAETVTVGGVTPAVEDVGKILTILRRQPDNSWLIAVWCWNSDLPLPEEGSGT